MYLANQYIVSGHLGTYAVVANKIHATFDGRLSPINLDKNYFIGLTKCKVKRYGKDKPSEASA